MDMISKNGCLIVSFDQDIDEASYGKVKEEIDNAYKTTNSNKLVFDFNKTKNISDNTLNLTLGRFKRVSESNGQMFITNAKGNTDKVLNMHGVYNIVPNVKLNDLLK